MKKKDMGEEYKICCVYGAECSVNKIRHILIKGKVQKICQE